MNSTRSPGANTSELVIARASDLGSIATRRHFLRVLSTGGTLVFLPAVLTSCGEDDQPAAPDENDPAGHEGGDPVTLDLSTDLGIFNYAYALEQLEAAFYIEVVTRFDEVGISDEVEQSIFTDIRDHEVIHREFFRAALGEAAIPDLEVDFGEAFASRQSVLETARTFEDLGVSAYNGAGKYLADANNLLVAGKIVSVEARHASVIRDLLDETGRAFAGDDVVDEQGLDVAREPADVLPLADPFVVTELTIGTGPEA